MGALSQTVTINDRMSPAFGAMTKSISSCVGAFTQLKAATGTSVDTTKIESCKVAMQGLNSAAQDARVSITEDTSAQKSFNRSMREGQSAASGLGSKIKSFIGAYVGIQGIRAGIGYVKEMMTASNAATEASTKLTTVMHQRMNATDADVQSILNLTAAQQKLGVIEDDTATAGAQQLGTFVNSTSALATLIPAMNNLAAQQNGVNATSGDLVNIGNLMGKVMQGQTGALTRVGITFTEAQEKVLKYGNEQERAAMLAQVITDNVGDMNAALAATPEGQMAQMKNSFGDMQEELGAQLTPAVMNLFYTINSNMPSIQSAAQGLGNVLSGVINTAARGIALISEVGSFIADNWSIIEPIVLGVAGAFTVYTIAVEANNIAQGIHAGLSAASALAEHAHAASTAMASGATFSATVAQYGLNAALLACPLTWIVGGIALVVVALYAGVAAFNKFHGTSVSATGIVAAAFTVLWAHINNTFVVPFHNGIAAFVNFFANVWTHPIASVKILFFDMANTVIGYVLNMAKAIETVINKIPGVKIDITSGLSNLQTGITDAAAKAKSESGYKTVMSQKSYTDYTSAASTGYEAGKNFAEKVKSKFSAATGTNTAADAASASDSALSSIADSSAATAANTGKTADCLDSSEDKLAYLKEYAEREIIDRTVFKSITVDMGGVSNTVKNIADLDAIPDQLARVMQEQMQTSMEGA